MRPRVHVPPCGFCKKQFQRTEHLRRHERTRESASIGSACHFRELELTKNS